MKQALRVVAAFARTRVVWIFALALAFAGGRSLAETNAAPPSTDGPQITFDATEHNFGSVDRTQALEHTFKVKNTGKRALELKDVKPACECTKVQSFDKKIEPGAEGSIRVRLDATNQRGPTKKFIMVISNDPKTPMANLALVAEVRADLLVLPSDSIFLDGLRPETETNHVIVIKSSMPAPIEVVKIETRAPWLKAEPVSSTTNSATIRFVTRPPLPLGTSRTVVHVHLDSGKHTVVSLAASIRVPESISVQPERLTFMKAVQRDMYTRVRRNDGKEFRITGLKANSDLLQCTVTTNQPGVDYTVKVSYAPQGDKKPADGKIEILTDEPTRSKVELPYTFR